MKALRVMQNRTLFFADVPKPSALKEHEVLVRMKYASICGYDMLMLKGRAAFPIDGKIGHEGSGIIVETGALVDPFYLNKGDAVALDYVLTCGQCEACKSNRREYCTNVGLSTDFMSEYVVVSDRQCHKLPEGVSLKEGCLTEPLTLAVHTVKKANLSYGKSVIIFGCGAMGQIILKLLKKVHSGLVVVADPHKKKREAALKFGADYALVPSEDLFSQAMNISRSRGYDVVIEASGSKTSAQNSVNYVARGGSVIFFGLYGMNYSISLNLFNLYWKDANISALCPSSGLFPAALKIMKDLNISEVITGVYPFAQGIQAFDEKRGGEHAKIMLEF